MGDVFVVLASVGTQVKIAGVTTQRERPVLVCGKKRKLYVATCAIKDSLGTLTPQRGAHVTTVTRAGDVVGDRVRDPHARLVANISDRLLIVGPGADEFAIAYVDGIEQSGYDERLSVRVVVGKIEPATKRVQVMTMNGLS